MVDSITEEILNASLAGVVKQMQEALFRTGFSTIIRESHDASCAVLTSKGDVAAQHIVLPLHLGVFPVSIRAVLKSYSADNIRDGDAFLVNHPYIGGSPHAPDMCVIVPVFVEGELAYFTASIAHKSDIGGSVPGSCSGKATDIYSEGIHFPPIRFVRNREISPEIETLIRANSRSAELVMGDIRGQLGCGWLGLGRIIELVDKYGRGTIDNAIDQRIASVERTIREEFRQWKDGSACGDRLLDDDGVRIGQSIRIAVTVKKDGDQVVFDFCDSDDQAVGPANIRPSLVKAACAYVVISSLDREITVNQGVLNAIEILTRPGSLLEPELPAPMNTYNPTVHAVINATFDALGQLTEMIQRADGSDSRSLIFGFPKKSNETGPTISYEIFAGGSGASSVNRGLTGCHVNQTNGRITPIEILETEYPLRITEFSVMKNSGGRGLFSGGDAFRRVYQALENGIRLSIRSSRHQIPPRGVGGGEDGKPGSAVLYPDGESKLLSSREVNVPLNRGESFALDTPSGGGCGDLSEFGQKSTRVA